MKLCVWGGPMDGRVADLPAPRPIVAMVERPVTALWSSDPVGVDVLPSMSYEPRQITVPWAARHRDWPEVWWVLMPSGISDEEADRLLAEHTGPVVDGGWADANVGEVMKYIVLRHAADVPQDKRELFFEGRWFDADQFPVTGARRTHAYAEPADDGRVEYREDGQAAEVWEIHLVEP